jgi:hypothetical protein
MGNPTMPTDPTPGITPPDPTTPTSDSMAEIDRLISNVSHYAMLYGDAGHPDHRRAMEAAERTLRGYIAGIVSQRDDWAGVAGTKAAALAVMADAYNDAAGAARRDAWRVWAGKLTAETERAEALVTAGEALYQWARCGCVTPDVAKPGVCAVCDARAAWKRGTP